MFGKSRPLPLEPLRDLAEFAWKTAPHSCAPDGPCRDYHSVWSMIRYLELGGASPAGQAFFAYGLAHLRHAERPRILISGGADTGLLANAVAAFEGATARPQFIFADICPTPVAQNARFAEQAGFDLECIQTDIVALDIEPVDAVLAHSFLGFFPPERRADVVATWARVLKPGGLALIANQTAARPGQVRSMEDRPEFAVRAQRIRELAAAEFGYDNDELDALQRAVAEFPYGRTRQPSPTEEEIRLMMEEAGLGVELVAIDAANRTRGPASRVESAKRSTRRAFLARKT